MKSFLRRITLTNLAIYAFIIAQLIIFEGEAPYLGVSLLLIFTSTLIFKQNSCNKREKKPLFFFCILLALLFVTTTNPATLFFNFALWSLLNLRLYFLHKSNWSITDIFLSPFNAFITILSSTLKLDTPTESATNRTKLIVLIRDSVISVFITIFFIVIIGLLLEGSNPIFDNLFSQFINSIAYFEGFLRRFVIEPFTALPAKIIFTIILTSVWAKIVSFLRNDTKTDKSIESYIPSKWVTMPKIVTAIMLIIYIITQLKYFLLDIGKGILDLSVSEYTNEIFFQLTLASAVVLSLVLLDKSRTKMAKLTSFLLLTESIFMVLVGLRSVLIYTSEWGYTIKRLYGYSAIAFLTGIILLTFVYIYSQKKDSLNLWTKHAIYFASFIILAINFLNFDKLIASKNQARTHIGIDYIYLTELSTDSGELASLHNKLLNLLATESTPEDRQLQLYALQNTVNYIEQLKDTYKTFSPRKFNLSSYLQYLKVKDINTDRAKEILNQSYFQNHTQYSF